MLNKPKFMKPSTNKEECTIDLTANEIPFSCIVDGNESITKWQIKIYDITNDEEVLDTGETLLDAPFYPVDEKNRNVVFSVDIKKYLEDNDKFVNRVEAYYWTITLVGSSGCSTTSYQEVFYANKTPDISISYKYLTGEDYFVLSDKEENKLTSRACTFKATLSFGDNELEYKAPLKRYGWRITDTDSGQVFIDTITRNQIYGSADNIICNYNGFLNDGNYSVELFIETQNNTKVTSTPFKFTVSYISTILSNDFRVETLKNESAIMLDWNKSVVIGGVLKDANDNIINVSDTVFRTNYPVKTQDSINIPVEFKVIYDYDANSKLDINESSYVALSTQLLYRKDTTLFVIEGYDDDGCEIRRKLSYIVGEFGGEFKYEVVGHNGANALATYKVIHNPSEYVWYNILMSPLIHLGDDIYGVNLEVFETKVVNCIFPSENLYPMAETAWTNVGSRYFYPISGDWVREEQQYGV